MKKTLYALPELPYGYKDLEPYMSEEVLTLHHKKHHQSYINAANAILEKMYEARQSGAEQEKSNLKSLSFNAGGHILHSIFWRAMKPAEGKINKSTGRLAEAIDKEFGSFDRFKSEFSAAANSVEGSGWAILTYHKETDRLLIMQAEKHNLNFYPEHKILLPLDVWEHSYYLDYKNERPKFVEAFFNIINWEEADKRFNS